MLCTSSNFSDLAKAQNNVILFSAKNLCIATCCTCMKINTIFYINLQHMIKLALGDTNLDCPPTLPLRQCFALSEK